MSHRAPSSPTPCGNPVPHRAAGARFGSKPRRKDAGLTLLEIAFAVIILAATLMGVLQAMMQSRRMTEGSIRQSSVASLVQGYMEQFKSVKYASDSTNALPSSPTTTPATTAAWAAAYALPAKNSEQQNITIYLAVGTPPTSADAATFAALPTDISRLVEPVDIDNSNSTADDSTLTMWVWVTDLTGATTNVSECKKITIAYSWTVKDGGRVTTSYDIMRTIRSIVPST